MYESSQYWPYVYLWVGLFVKRSRILTRERSPSCLPYILYFLPSVYKALISKLPNSIPNIYCFSPCLSVVSHCGLLIVIHTCQICTTSGPLHLLFFCWNPVLPGVFMVSFAHFIYASVYQVGVSWHPVNECMPYHSALFFFRKLVTAWHNVIQLFYFLSLSIRM